MADCDQHRVVEIKDIISKVSFYEMDAGALVVQKVVNVASSFWKKLCCLLEKIVLN